MSDIKDKYEKLRLKTLADVQKLYPNQKVDVVFHGETRTKEEQNKHKKSGASTTNASLHMVGGARDFNIKIDGKVLGNSDKDFKVYKDILWKNAKDSGFHHLDEDGFGRTDPYHIGLVKEKGDGTAFNRLFKEYPELTKDENVKASIANLQEHQKSNPNDTTYSKILNAFNDTTDDVKVKAQLRNAEIATLKQGLKDTLKGKTPEQQKKIIADAQVRVDKKYGVGGGDGQKASTSTFNERYAARNAYENTPKKKVEKPKSLLPKKETPKVMAETKEAPKEEKTAPSTYNYGLKDHAGNDIPLKGKYATAKEKEMLETELARIESIHGKNSDEAKKFRANRFERVYLPELREGYRKKIEDAQSRFDNATSPEDVKQAKADLDKNTKIYDRTNTKDPWVKSKVQNIWTDNNEKGADIPMRYEEWTGSFMNELNEDIAQEEAKVTPPYEGNDPIKKEQAKEQAKTKTQKQADITALPPKRNPDGTYSGGTGNTEKDLAEAKENLESIKNLYSAERAPFEYAPDSQSDTDVLGNLIDVSAGVAGMMGAMEDVPTYERGSMWTQAMDEAERMRNEGLSPQELDYRNKQAETAYAYNVKNIRRGAGGSAGAYLGNVQSASAGLYDQYGKTAAIDEGLRRQNRANFQQMAGNDETINRRIFEDDLDQVMASKQQGAALVSDALRNIKDRRDYRRNYGKDSPYYQYNRDMAEEAHGLREDRKILQEDNKRKALRSAEFQENQAQDAYDNDPSNSLTPGETVKTEETIKPSGSNLSESVIAESTVAESSAPKDAVQRTIGDKAYDEQEVSTGTKVNEVTGEEEKASKFTPKETEDIPLTETDADGNVRKFATKSEAKVSQAQTFKKGASKKYKEEIDMLEESMKYTGNSKEEKALRKETKARIKDLKKKIKDGTLTDEDIKKYEKMLSGSGVTAKDLEGAK